MAAERADIVFIDIGMPEMNGLEAAEWIQQLDSYSYRLCDRVLEICY
ncbi:response regulator transcription factor [Paenibacillus peoriae]|nr:hypothetical protein [Paenibacillus peoriae]